MYNFHDLEQSSLQIRIEEPHLASLSPPPPLFPLVSKLGALWEVENTPLVRRTSCNSIHTSGMSLCVLCVTHTLMADDLLVDTLGLGYISLPGTFLQLEH